MNKDAQYVSTTEWGSLQDPPIGQQRVYELVRDDRIPGAQLVGGVFMVPRNAKRLPPNEKSRARHRAMYSKYYSKEARESG
jgi:hypothetical protein